MKNIFRRILSLSTAIILVVSLISVAYASELEEDNYLTQLFSEDTIIPKEIMVHFTDDVISHIYPYSREGFNDEYQDYSFEYKAEENRLILSDNFKADYIEADGDLIIEAGRNVIIGNRNKDNSGIFVSGNLQVLLNPQSDNSETNLTIDDIDASLSEQFDNRETFDMIIWSGKNTSAISADNNLTIDAGTGKILIGAREPGNEDYNYAYRSAVIAKNVTLTGPVCKNENEVSETAYITIINETPEYFSGGIGIETSADNSEVNIGTNVSISGGKKRIWNGGYAIKTKNLNIGNVKADFYGYFESDNATGYYVFPEDTIIKVNDEPAEIPPLKNDKGYISLSPVFTEPSEDDEPCYTINLSDINDIVILDINKDKFIKSNPDIGESLSKVFAATYDNKGKFINLRIIDLCTSSNCTAYLNIGNDEIILKIFLLDSGYIPLTDSPGFRISNSGITKIE